MHWLIIAFVALFLLSVPVMGQLDERQTQKHTEEGDRAYLGRDLHPPSFYPPLPSYRADWPPPQEKGLWLSFLDGIVLLSEESIEYPQKSPQTRDDPDPVQRVGYCAMFNAVYRDPEPCDHHWYIDPQLNE